MYISSERLYVNKDYSQIVPEGSIEAAYLLCHIGQPVEDALAEKLGLLSKWPAIEPVAGEELPAEVSAASGEGAPEDTGELTPTVEDELVNGEKDAEVV